MMKMRPVASLAVEPDETLVFQPGGYHLMLFDLQAPLMPGETHSITLVSENCGEALVTAEVQSLLQKSAPITPMKHHAGHNMHSGHSTGDRK
jgi:copper(I)-binding protein